MRFQNGGLSITVDAPDHHHIKHVVMSSLLPGGGPAGGRPSRPKPGGPLVVYRVHRGLPVGADAALGVRLPVRPAGAGINLPIFWKLALPIAMGMTPAKAMRLVIMPQAVGR
jgi:hypothetical protein